MDTTVAEAPAPQAPVTDTPAPAAPAPEPTTPTPEATPAPFDHEAALDGMSIEALQALLEKPPEAFAPEVPAATPAAPAPAPAAPEPPEPPEETIGEALPKNWRLSARNEQQARFLKLQKEFPDANPIELARRAGYESPTVAPAAPPEPVKPPEPEKDPAADLESQLVTLRTELKQATDNYERDKEIELLEKIADLKSEIKDRRRDAQDHKAAEAEYEAEFTVAFKQAGQLAPETLTKGTPQFEEVLRERTYLEATDPEFFNDPSYPTALLSRVAKRRPDLFPSLGKPATPPPAPPPAPAARAVGETLPTNPGSPPAKTAKQLEAEIDALSPEDLLQLANEVGTKTGRGVKVFQ